MQIPYIRPYNIDDLPALTAINQRLEVLPFNQEWALGHYLSLVTKENGSCYVAEDGGNTIVGFGLLRPLPDPTINLGLHLAVDPDHQHSGVGKALLETLKQVASHRGATSIITVLQEEDLEVISFVEAMNFSLRNYSWKLVLEQPALASLEVGQLPSDFEVATVQAGQETQFQNICRRAMTDNPRFDRYNDSLLGDLLRQENYMPGDIITLKYKSETVGLAVLQLNNGSQYGYSAQIEPLGVIPSFRGRGLEQFFLKKALVRARERGALEAETWLHGADNLLLDVFESVGFVRVGSRLTYICNLFAG